MVFGKEHATELLSKTPIAFVGTMVQVTPGMSTRSMPPINHYKLRFEHIRALRGSAAATEFGYHQHGAGFLLHESVQNADGSESAIDRGHEQHVKEPIVGTTYLACSTDGHHIDSLAELDNHTVDQLLNSSQLPLGWSKQANGHYDSPWQHAHTKHAKWYDHPRFARAERCAASGRPLLMTANEISLSCEPVPPAHIKEFQNPNGDGKCCTHCSPAHFHSS